MAGVAAFACAPERSFDVLASAAEIHEALIPPTATTGAPIAPVNLRVTYRPGPDD